MWYRRPPKTGEKLDSRWIGPGKIVAREGENSYEVEIKDGITMKAPRSFLKPYTEPKFEGHAVPLYYHRRTESEIDAAPDEWETEAVIAHRVCKDGHLEFLTKWVGCEKGSETWEPVGNFFHRYGSDLIKYCKEHEIPLDVVEYLSPTPSH